MDVALEVIVAAEDRFKRIIRRTKNKGVRPLCFSFFCCGDLNFIKKIKWQDIYIKLINVRCVGGWILPPVETILVPKGARLEKRGQKYRVIIGNKKSRWFVGYKVEYAKSGAFLRDKYQTR